jgi:ABC-type glycerol-3-phosphate transport system substrate-binding protein
VFWKGSRYQQPRSIKRYWVTCAVLLSTLAAGLVSGCAELNQRLPPELLPRPSATLGPATATTEPTEVATPRASTPTPVVTTLTLWTTEALGPVGQSAGQRQLAAQIAAFEAANPDVRVTVILKEPYGRGGMLDFLTRTAAAVPELLPDVAVLDTRELAAASRRELIQPLDGRIGPELAQDLVAPARQAGHVDESWLGLPFQADVQHLIYNRDLVSAQPITWTDVLSSSTQYLFPAGGQGAVTDEGDLVNDSFIVQYLATGAALSGEGGQAILDADATAAVLQFYADGLAAGVIPHNAIEFASVAQTWPLYLAEEIGLANTSAHLYLENRANFRKSSFAAIPTRDGEMTAVYRGWAYVLVARQPERQKAAWSLIEWLTSAERLGEWALSANYVPTRLSAWPDDAEDGYRAFLAEVLQNAHVLRTGAGHDEVARALQRAVESVFDGTSTPGEAAVTAAASVP